jgi:hypothetical protein
MDPEHLAEEIESLGRSTIRPRDKLAADDSAARGDAAIDTRSPLTTFPEVCPWPVAQVLDEDIWPER